MPLPHRAPAFRRALLLAGAVASLAACSPSPSSGSGGSSETRREIIVLPPGATIVCADGKAPPC